MLNPNSLSIISSVFTDRRERAAPSECGAVLTWRMVPESRSEGPRRLDPPGQVLAIIVLGALVYGIIEGPTEGWTSPVIIGCFAAALAALVAFVNVEQRRDEPLLELRFFRSPPLSGAAIMAVLGFLILAGYLFLNTLYLQEVRGDSALAGLSTLPATAIVALVPHSPAAWWGGVEPGSPSLPRAWSWPRELRCSRSTRRTSTTGTWRSATCSSAWIRSGQSADHQHRTGRDAWRSGGGGGGRDVDRPPGWRCPRCGDPRIGRHLPVPARGRRPAPRPGSPNWGPGPAQPRNHRLGGPVGGGRSRPGGDERRAPGVTDASHAGWLVAAGCGVAISVAALVTTGPAAVARARRAVGDL